MADKTKDVKAPATEIDWGQIQEELDRGAGGGSTWLLPSKNPNMRIRLLQSPNDAKPFVPVDTEYQGKMRQKYLMFCAEAPNGPIKVVVLTKTAFRAIVQLATNGWDLWDPKTGVAIIVSKFTTGGRSNYAVTPAGQKGMAIDDEIIEELGTLTLAQAAEDFAEWQEYMAQKRNGVDGAEAGDQE